MNTRFVFQRRAGLALALSALGFAASPAALAAEPSGPARQQILAAHARYKAAWNDRDAAGVGAAFGATGTFKSAAMTAPVQGSEAIAKAVAVTLTAFPDFQVKVDSNEFLDDRRMVERWTISGTWTHPFPAGPFAGLTPTGKRFSVTGASFYTWDGTKLESYENYYNVLSLMVQIGAVSLPPTAAR